MAQARALISFQKYSDAEIENKGLTIVTRMTGNADFPNPTVPLADISTTLTEYSAALVASHSRDKVSISVKNDKRKTLEAMLKSNGNYVNMVADGNRSMILGSGYSVSAETRTARKLGSTSNFTAEQGKNSGEVFCSMDPVPGASGYICLYGEAPISNDQWRHALNKSPNFVLTDLEPLKMHSFRMGAVGTGGTVYTEIITKPVA